MADKVKMVGNAKPAVNTNAMTITKPAKKPKKPAFKVDGKKLQEIAVSTGFDKDYLKKLIDFEGFRKTHYSIADGNTIGIGHYMDDDPNFKAALKEGRPITITEKEVYRLFEKDLLKKKAEVQTLLPNFNRLKKGQQKALTDLSFNADPSSLGKSNLISAVKNGKFDEAVKEFDFVKANGQVLPGLCRRRIYDIGLFAEGMQPDNAKIAINDIIEKCGSRDDLIIAGQQAIENLEMSWASKKPPNNPFVAINR